MWSEANFLLGSGNFWGVDLPIILCNFLVSEYRRLECLVTRPIGRSKTSVQVLGIVPEKKTRKLFDFRLRESINLLRWVFFFSFNVIHQDFRTPCVQYGSVSRPVARRQYHSCWKKLKITDAFTWTILSAGMISYLLTKCYLIGTKL